MTHRAPRAAARSAPPALLLAAVLGGAAQAQPAVPTDQSAAERAAPERAAPARGALPPAPSGPATAAPAPEAQAEDIRDIRGPRFILPWWLVPAALAAAALVGALTYALVRWLRRRRRPRALLPFELALRRLEEIRPLMQPPTAREFSTAVSDVVRGYIEVRFEVIATHRTTEEFLRDLLQSSAGALLRHRALLSEFLHQCDLVKFAGISLTRQNIESLHDSARVFVLETAKPDPEPAAADPPPPVRIREAHDSLPSA